MRATKPSPKRNPIPSRLITAHTCGREKESCRFSISLLLSADGGRRLRYLAWPKEGHVAAGHA
jgi:hypothetical protein